MKKDVIVALFIGFSIGALIAFVAVRLPVMLEKEASPADTDIKVSASPAISLTESAKLEITSPADGSIQDDTSVNVTGIADTKTPVIIETAQDSFIVESGEDGKFSGKITLVEGANPVYVSMTTENGNIETVNLNLFYTSEKI